MKKSIFAIPVMSLLLISCGLVISKTDIRTFNKHDNFNKKFTRILVEANLNDLLKKDILEKALVYKLQENGIVSSTGSDIVSVFSKDNRKKQQNEITKKYKIDGWMKINLVSEEKSTQISSMPNFATKGTTVYSTRANTTSLKCELFETNKWECIWVAATLTTTVDDFKTIADHAAGKIVNKMKKDGLI